MAQKKQGSPRVEVLRPQTLRTVGPELATTAEQPIREDALRTVVQALARSLKHAPRARP